MESESKDEREASHRGRDVIMGKWEARWKHDGISLCIGYWELYHDGVKVDTKIPFATEPAGTYGDYDEWTFDEDWNDIWDSYEDGFDMSEWVADHSDWLATIAPESEWPAIYDAFSSEDWRPGSCGACI